MNWKRNGLVYILVLIAAVALFSFLMPTLNEPKQVSLEKVVVMSQNSELRKLLIDGDQLLITTREGTELRTNIPNMNYVDLQELGLDLKGVDYSIKSSGVNWGQIALNFLPLILFGGLLFFLFRRSQGANSQALNFGRSRARLFPASTPTVTFDDVAGVDEAKQQLREVVEFLKDRAKFQALGARVPRGVLLVGPPGTGKTLLARAVAGEAGVPFFSISGSEFVEMFVGVGASRVRDLFEQAKRHTPCIIFIDEIDAVGRQRGAGLGGGHDEREQTLNQILTEMDGFDTNTSVIVVAATNRPDILDPALLRPGRFDRRVVLDRPDIIGRTAILKVHTTGKPLGEGVDLETLAKQTAGFSGADLANLVNEAAILAARRNKKVIDMPELEESIDQVIAGPERKSRKMNSKEKEITAYHEAGHALVARMLPNADPVRKVSIIPRGISGGHTSFLAEDRYIHTRAQFEDMLASVMGGRCAEELIFNQKTTGAAADIKWATAQARRMVTDYGMSDKLGPRTFGDKQELVFLGREISEQRDYGEKVARMIDEEVDAIIRHAEEVAMKVLAENRDKLTRIAQELIARETLEDSDLDAITGVARPSAAAPTATAEPVPEPVEDTAKVKSKSKKAHTTPQSVPNPATST